MPSQPSNPKPTADDIRIPCKRQARLDENSEPAGVPASKKMKPAEQNISKKRRPAKTSTKWEKKTTPPAKNTPPVETGVSDPVNKATNPHEAAVDGSESSDDDVVIVEKDEEPEEDDEAELGAYLLLNKIVNC